MSLTATQIESIDGMRSDRISWRSIADKLGWSDSGLRSAYARAKNPAPDGSEKTRKADQEPQSEESNTSIAFDICEALAALYEPPEVDPRSLETDADFLRRLRRGV